MKKNIFSLVSEAEQDLLLQDMVLIGEAVVKLTVKKDGTTTAHRMPPRSRWSLPRLGKRKESDQ